MLGATFSMDEMTMNLKTHHEDKIRMVYKAEGDWLQTDDIFQKVYTYKIFMWNDPVSICLAKSMLPIDAIVTIMFYALEE